MPSPIEITDYSIYDRPPYLLEQFKGTDIQKFVSIFNQQFQEIENAAFSFINDFAIQNAYGNMLDVWGLRLGLARNGRDDDSYRTLLLVQGYINSGPSIAEKIITAMRILLNTDEIHYVPDPPAKVQINKDGTAGIYLYLYYNWIDNEGDQMVTDLGDILIWQQSDVTATTMLDEIMPAGVGLIINYVL